jgi:hypothetical protein
MNRWTSVAFAGLGLLLAHPAAAQLQGLPVYFSPKGGTGITFSGDFGRVSSTKLNGVSSPAHPTAIGARVSLGLPFVTVGVGAAVFDPKIATQDNELQYAGTAALKVFGGPLVPLAISLQAGVGYLKQGSGTFAAKNVNVPIGLGAALNIPTPGASLEPWVAARGQLRSTSVGAASATQFGVGLSGGLSVGLPIGLGLHVAADWSRFGAKTSGALMMDKVEQLVIGIGAHYSIRLPGVPLVPGI